VRQPYIAWLGWVLLIAGCRLEVDHTSPTDCRGPWPDSGSTGWASTGVSLQPYTGPQRIVTDGTVIDGADITRCLEIAADRVTIRRSRIRANQLCTTNNALLAVSSPGGASARVVLEDLELDGLSLTGRGVSGTGFEARRLDVHGVAVGFLLLGDSTAVRDSYVHDLAGTTGAAVACDSATSVVLQHNDLQNRNTSDAAVFLTSNSAPIHDVLLQGNRFAGGGWVIYGGFDPQKSYPNATGIQFSSNCFSRMFFLDGGYFGPVTAFDAKGTGNIWRDNHWEDTGAIIPVP
jgi:hypothetical protein